MYTHSAAAEAAAAPPPTRTASGLEYTDVKAGEGPSPKAGTKVTIEYVMMTTGARYGNKIDSTKARAARPPATFSDPLRCDCATVVSGPA